MQQMIEQQKERDAVQEELERRREEKAAKEKN